MYCKFRTASWPRRRPETARESQRTQRSQRIGRAVTARVRRCITAYTTDVATSPLTSPSLSDSGGGFTFGICNASTTKSHTLQALTAKITAFTGYGGQLSQWNGCDGATNRHHQRTGGGCGSAMPGCLCFHAPFAGSAGAGTEVTTTQVDDSLYAPGDHAGKLCPQ